MSESWETWLKANEKLTADILAEHGGQPLDVAAQPSSQAKYNLVLAYYLAEEISLSRAAELLDIPWLDLRTHFLRLDVPLRAAPADLDEAQADVANAAKWFENRLP
jgi:hypothetical protein